ncbi:nitrate- and nitrite sensing domain-containing protein [Streptomyces sp. UNOB3_S3]|uniref:sensor histidine kinase n=1 Tax=Streptomyces sp. UNOB3_S3 TaxID=2871682 RepID=UPI001E5090D2|nr:nitrate- and nitrite sensing domain-containing protein [Streptomyces sp. UNOB3_S3]MCC3775722.1 nitrate- and nitrite sensing domain-containing protein [Streptomyces sp. UNOB3_S3]
MRFRGKSIRRKIVTLLLVPLVSLTGLWAFATVITGNEAVQLMEAADVMRTVGYPAGDMVRTLQKERRQTLVHLADARRADVLDTLRAEQRATDKAVAAFRAGIRGDVREDMSPTAARRFRILEKTLDGLPGVRRKAEDGDLTRYAALQAYNDIIEPYYDFLGSLAALQDAETDRQSRAMVGLGRAREAVAREDALLAAALAAGSMSRQDLRAFSDHIAERRTLYNTHLAVLPVAEQKTYEDYWRGTNAEALRAAEDTVVLAGSARAPHTIDARRWQTTVTPVLDDLGRMSTEAIDRFSDRVRPVALGVITKAVVAGILGLIALVCSVVISFRVGRDLVKDLHRLRKEAHEASGVRLPGVMRRLAAGERVDVEAEVPRLVHGPDELGQVGQALDTLQRAAVEAAVKQADLRRGVSDVFVNLARRNQVLLHRQLTLLDAMERRTEDTDHLADLFRLDHLTTRMRRHAEGLVILSGAAPSRQWRKPVPLMDVVRAAVGEVEAYERIEVRRLPRLALDGPAVADLTHLLAELLENATVFSPPHTAVHVLGERVPNGFALEIHDRGLGMGSDALPEANLRLADPVEFELSDTDRLGLFVVGRLARRQGVRVSLQPSPYGGTTAVVLIPSALLTESAPRGARADREDTGGRPVVRRPARRAVLPHEETHQQAADGPHDERTPTGGLPRRVRQASLAPQLREPAPAETARTRPAPEPDRDAEEVRARMAALQRGWQRAREDNEMTTSTTAPRTTTEGDGR